MEKSPADGEHKECSDQLQTGRYGSHYTDSYQTDRVEVPCYSLSHENISSGGILIWKNGFAFDAVAPLISLSGSGPKLQLTCLPATFLPFDD